MTLASRKTPEGNLTTAFDAQMHDDGAVWLSGELDINTAETFVRTASAAMERSGALTLDLSQLGFIDSSGIRAIVTLAQRAPDGVTLREPANNVRMVVEITGIVGRSGITWAEG